MNEHDKAEKQEETEQARKLGGTPDQAQARVETFDNEGPPPTENEVPRDYADRGERTEDAEFVQVEDDADLGVRETENRG